MGLAGGRSRLGLGFATLVVADMGMAFLWVFLNAVLRTSVDLAAPSLGIHGTTRQLIKRSLVVGLLFVFYWLSTLTGGATYNPLTVIAYAAAKMTHNRLYLLSLRIPAQIVGAVGGAFVAVASVPEVYRPMMRGPCLRVDPHIGAMVEGVLTFAAVFIVLAANLKGPKSGIRRTWITSISRVSLSILGAEYTGPAINPANAFGWAFWKNQHNTWEHLYVYWITPLLATLAAAWVVRAILVPKKVKEKRS